MAIAAAAAAVSALGLGIYQGQQADKQQRRALHSQEQAQREASNRATSQQRASAMEEARLNQKKPNTNSILAGEQAAAGKGAGATMLTGASGVDPSKLLLGKTSLLGG